jgi:hypothetical protein
MDPVTAISSVVWLAILKKKKPYLQRYPTGLNSAKPVRFNRVKLYFKTLCLHVQIVR